jgi:hypothetical protein
MTKVMIAEVNVKATHPISVIIAFIIFEAVLETGIQRHKEPTVPYESIKDETLDDFQQTTLHYIPEDRILHNHSHENLKFQNNYGVST